MFGYYSAAMLSNRDMLNIAIGVIMVFLGTVGFVLLKLTERKKDKK